MAYDGTATGRKFVGVTGVPGIGSISIPARRPRLRIRWHGAAAQGPVAVPFRCPAKEFAPANKSSPAEMSRTAKAAGEIKGLPG